MKLVKSVFLCFTCLLLLNACSFSQEENTVSQESFSAGSESASTASSASHSPESTSGMEDSENPIDSITPDQYGNFSADFTQEVAAYSERTEDGITLYRVNNDFTSGYLSYTVKEIRLVTDLNDVSATSDGFFEEACYGRDADNNFVHLSRPACINDDGSFQEGNYLIWIDLLVENHDAAMRTDLPGYFTDPYVFRADTLLFLVSRDDPNRFPPRNINYSSEKGQTAGHECAFYLAPGESLNLSVGFLMTKEDYGDAIDFSQFQLCNTSGNASSVFLDLNLEEG